jgi:hypothetical protein
VVEDGGNVDIMKGNTVSHLDQLQHSGMSRLEWAPSMDPEDVNLLMDFVLSSHQSKTGH